MKNACQVFVDVLLLEKSCWEVWVYDAYFAPGAGARVETEDAPCRRWLLLKIMFKGIYDVLPGTSAIWGKAKHENTPSLLPRIMFGTMNIFPGALYRRKRGAY